ncbi:GNAT family N-acetyltransferase [Streptomyces sp. P9(2023)]|uniref:GNAT family N-acetyltransferase n=1 Tax=Streptomyces sp. P9(2023) TaxID=3064394 RepID=UPI0028F45AC9|nr:GNAT family N-acetyltransferase [Streptomyces sp. P9(2023)]MDT9689624.1 GNAT family N-acetyltransferase [Streptomyces sp. P9(2023)]
MTIRALTAEDMAARRDEWIALCAQAFCGPPWREPPREALRTVERLFGMAAAGQPGFRCVASFGADGELTGFAAGWLDTMLSGAEQAFELAELVVAPAHQGHGLGRALHDELLAQAPTPRLLMTLDVPELRERYERWGWQVVEHRSPEKDGREFVVMRGKP